MQVTFFFSVAFGPLLFRLQFLAELVTLSGDSAGRKIGSAVAFGDAMWMAVGWDLRAESARKAESRYITF